MPFELSILLTLPFIIFLLFIIIKNVKSFWLRNVSLLCGILLFITNSFIIIETLGNSKPIGIELFEELSDYKIISYVGIPKVKITIFLRKGNTIKVYDLPWSNEQAEKLREAFEKAKKAGSEKNGIKIMKQNKEFGLGAPTSRLDVEAHVPNDPPKN